MSGNTKQEYNAQYYAKNKQTILPTLLKKCQCDVCGRTVNYQQMPRHKKSSYCQKAKDKKWLKHEQTGLDDLREQAFRFLIEAHMKNIERLHDETQEIFRNAQQFVDFKVV